MKAYLNVGPSPVTIPGKGSIEPGDTVQVDDNVATSFYGDPNWEALTGTVTKIVHCPTEGCPYNDPDDRAAAHSDGRDITCPHCSSTLAPGWPAPNHDKPQDAKLAADATDDVDGDEDRE